MFSRCLDVAYVRVNPKTGEVDDKDELNTYIAVWIECGPYLGYNDDAKMQEYAHDYDLDCGSNNFENALCELAILVHEKYGIGRHADWRDVRDKIKSEYKIYRTEDAYKKPDMSWSEW